MDNLLMTKNPVRIYADTSVYGGVFDDEFQKASNCFFDAIREKRFQLVVSDIIRREIAVAPEPVLSLFNEMLILAEVAEVTEDALHLRSAYMKEGILGPRWVDDALHVAIATVSRCDMIISWNFKHIVHFNKIPLYNAVNTLHGYNNILIYSPLEVIGYGAEDQDI